MLGQDSAPGPDGLSRLFFSSFWETIKLDVMGAVLVLFEGVGLPPAFSNTFITLLLKGLEVSTFEDFRPISLCNFINKIFIKILVSRLQPILQALISSEQSAFLQGREILDNILLSQDALQFLHNKSRTPNVIFKMDMQKAFDRMSWSFLEKLLTRFGFHPHFVRLVMNNLHSSFFSVLINGSPSGFSKASWGIKQGDPLSPYLFILLTEALSRRLKFLIDAKAIKHYKVSPRAIPIFHLYFADDLLIFMPCDRHSLRTFTEFFHCYECATGQKANRAKSSFIILARSPPSL